MHQENRSQPRFAYVELVTLVTPQGKVYVSQTENISLSGVFLIRDDPLPVGTEGLIGLKINSGNSRQVINSRFKVMHIGVSGQGSAGMGVAFMGMSEEDVSILKDAMDNTLHA